MATSKDMTVWYIITTNEECKERGMKDCDPARGFYCYINSTGTCEIEKCPRREK